MSKYSSGSSGGSNDDCKRKMTLFPMAGLALLGVHESDDEPVIQSQFTICSNNHPLEPLVVENSPQTTYLYTRNGPVETQHLSKKCKVCKTRYFHGFKYLDRARVYDDDVLSKSNIVKSTLRCS